MVGIPFPELGYCSIKKSTLTTTALAWTESLWQTRWKDPGIDKSAVYCATHSPRRQHDEMGSPCVVEQFPFHPRLSCWTSPQNCHLFGCFFLSFFVSAGRFHITGRNVSHCTTRKVCDITGILTPKHYTVFFAIASSLESLYSYLLWR